MSKARVVKLVLSLAAIVFVYNSIQKVLRAAAVRPREVDLPMMMPASQPGDYPAETVTTLIRVDAENQFFINDETEVKTIAQLGVFLKKMLKEAESEDAQLIIQVKVNDDCDQQAAIDILNVIRDSGISQVTFVE